MGLYGSPELGPYAEPKKHQAKQIKKDGYQPQKNVWVWAVIFVVNIVFLLFSKRTFADVITLLILDSIILFGISVVSLIVNLVKKRKIGNDIKFIGISVLTFLGLIMILGTL